MISVEIVEEHPSFNLWIQGALTIFYSSRCRIYTYRQLQWPQRLDYWIWRYCRHNTILMCAKIHRSSTEMCLFWIWIWLWMILFPFFYFPVTISFLPNCVPLVSIQQSVSVIRTRSSRLELYKSSYILILHTFYSGPYSILY